MAPTLIDCRGASNTMCVHDFRTPRSSGWSFSEYGDDPEVEPGELIGRVYLEAPKEPTEREQVLRTFHDTYGAAVREAATRPRHASRGGD